MILMLLNHLKNLNGSEKLLQALSHIKKYNLMKKNTTNFKTRCRTDHKKHSAVQQMEQFFQFNDLAVTKERIHTIMNYAIKRNVWINEDPLELLQFHQAMRSFVRAGYLIILKERKWAVSAQQEKVSLQVLGLLSESEYQNPLLVFQKAFGEYSIKEFDYFMSGMVYFSMGAYENLPERNIINPYIHLIKMLDAGFIIIKRRGGEKHFF